MLADRNAIEGDWLVALHQHSGRGRQGRTWASEPGNFFGSTLVALRPGDPPPQTLSLAAGVALIEAVDAAVPAQPLMLKWPNDLLLLGRKLAGILLERSGDRIAVGIGVNLAAAPVLEDREPAALLAGIAPQAFAPLLAASFARMLDMWRSGNAAAVACAWQDRAHPIGARLSVHVGKDEIRTGAFLGLDHDGALRLQLDDGSIELIRAGDVEL